MITAQMLCTWLPSYIGSIILNRRSEILSQVRRLKLWPWCVVLGVLCGCSSSTGTMTGLTPDFSLSVSTQSVFVPIGVYSGTVQLSVVASNGFSQSTCTLSYLIDPGDGDIDRVLLLRRRRAADVCASRKFRVRTGTEPFRQSSYVLGESK